MRLSPGARIGIYEVTTAIGAGGMGEVYRARDRALDRDVAIKILPEAFAADAERVARFAREARTLAALNHPNIAQVYGLEETPDRDGVPCPRGLVMELVEGEDLSQRLARGAMPLDEAVPIARQIAEALAAAHQQGIIHRDLKPGNIKLRRDGAVKVLDFGLAKVCGPDASDHNSGVADAITSPAHTTGVGVVLGTAAYMSPEQAKGHSADKRSDIWAFGVVFYEMLTGKHAFDGADATEVLGAVVRLEPDWEALPHDLPQPVRTLLRSCLVKASAGRVADISIALFVLDKFDVLTTHGGSPTPFKTSAARRLTLPIITAAVASLMAGIVSWNFGPTRDSSAAVVSRLTITPPRAAALTVNGFDPDLAITPDGSRVVYIGNNGTQLFVRALDTIDPVAVFTGSPRAPFMSPDGQWIGFVDNSTVLKKVAVSGGAAVTLTVLDGSAPRGATWGPDDAVIIATGSAASGLQRVAPDGTTTVLTRPDHQKGEADHLWPERLPGGTAVLFTITAVAGGLDASQIGVLDLATGKQTSILRGGSHARYVPGAAGRNTSGHLIYAAGGSLRAVAFDLESLTVSGTPVPALSDVVTTAQGAANSVVSGNGTLAYVSGGAAATQRTLTWVDRDGRETPLGAPPRAYLFPRLSPDGSRVSIFINDQDQDLWLWDVGRTTLSRTTFDPAIDSFPVWTADGRGVLFSSQRNGARNLFLQPTDSSAAIERLTESPNAQSATAVSHDGRVLIFTENSRSTGNDVMQVTLAEPHRVTPLVQSQFSERNGVVSPDGRWLAYEENSSGQYEIVVRSFTGATTGARQISVAGGTQPLWVGNGAELLYVAPSGAVMGVRAGRGAVWPGTAPYVVVKDGYSTTPPGMPGRTYDISFDGRRLLMVRQGAGSDAAPVNLTVVLNWIEELGRLAPVK